MFTKWKYTKKNCKPHCCNFTLMFDGQCRYLHHLETKHWSQWTVFSIWMCSLSSFTGVGGKDWVGVIGVWGGWGCALSGGEALRWHWPAHINFSQTPHHHNQRHLTLTVCISSLAYVCMLLVNYSKFTLNWMDRTATHKYVCVCVLWIEGFRDRGTPFPRHALTFPTRQG